jgi:hypothetical protein
MTEMTNSTVTIKKKIENEPENLVRDFTFRIVPVSGNVWVSPLQFEIVSLYFS